TGAAASAAIEARVAITAAIGWGHHHMAPGVLLRNTATQAIAFALGAYFCLLLLALRRAALARWHAAALLAMLALLLWRLFFHEIGRSGHLLFFVLLFASGLAALRGRLRVAAAVVVPLAAAVLLALSPVVRARFALAVHEMASVEQSREGTSMGGRVVMWRNGLALALERPLVGYGLAGVSPAYQARVQRTEAGWRAEPTTDVHNQYLMFWLEAGVAGPLAFLAFLIGAVRQPAPMPWRAIGLSILAGWCVNSLFSSHFGTFNEGHLIALLSGMFLAVGPARTPVVQDAGPAPSSAR
ncbi:MAG: O-antigen ligase family protein, partial [Burkholderiaceae bacterium]|nr:O-antigen ligase family protein [Burkholderiaceae bacterium]